MHALKLLLHVRAMESMWKFLNVQHSTYALHTGLKVKWLLDI